MSVDEEKLLKELITKIAKDYGLEDDYYSLFVNDGKKVINMNYIIVEFNRSFKDEKKN